MAVVLVVGVLIITAAAGIAGLLIDPLICLLIIIAIIKIIESLKGGKKSSKEDKDDVIN
jgi:hypothetical protein